MNDEEYGSLLLRHLDIDPPGPSRVDVARAMRDGRRGRRWRMWAAGIGTGAVITAATAGGVIGLADPDQEALPLLPPDPIVPTSCVVSTLPMGGERSAEVRGGDPTGTWLVGQGDPMFRGRNAIMVWRDGKLVASVVPAGRQPIMWDINGSGVAVGGTAEMPTIPYFYRDQKVSRMKGHGHAVAINSAGVVAGNHEKGGEALPQRWASPEAEPELMAMPAGVTHGRVRDIAEDGTVLVTLSTPRSGDDPHLWRPDGSVVPITPPQSEPGRGQMFNPAGFHYGWVYGMLHVTGASQPVTLRDPMLYRYDPQSAVWQVVSSGGLTMAQLPGYNGAGAGYMDRQARIFVGKEVLDLPTKPRNDDDGFLVAAISADARVVAGSNLSMSATVDRPVLPILWRCR